MIIFFFVCCCCCKFSLSHRQSLVCFINKRKIHFFFTPSNKIISTVRRRTKTEYTLNWVFDHIFGSIHCKLSELSYYSFMKKKWFKCIKHWYYTCCRQTNKILLSTRKFHSFWFHLNMKQIFFITNNQNKEQFRRIQNQRNKQEISSYSCCNSYKYLEKCLLLRLDTFGISWPLGYLCWKCWKILFDMKRDGNKLVKQWYFL